MASSKVMPSTSTSTNSDLNSLSSHPHHHHHHHNHNHHLHHNYNRNHSSSSSQMIPDFHSNNSNNNVDGILRDVYGDTSSINTNVNASANTLLDAEITLIDAAGAISAIEDSPAAIRGGSKTAEEVWREIVNGKSDRKECKVEAPDEMMTLEDFLAKAGAGIEGEDGVGVDADVKAEVSAGGGVGVGGGGLFAGFDHGMISSSYAAPTQMAVPVSMGYGNGGGGGMEMVAGGGGVRGKRRGGPMLEPLDKAAQQRQRRMIKNRESAARSRERKQAYQVELESLAHKLEEENEQLLREKAERTKERFKQLMEKVIPIEEKQRPPRVLRRVRSMQW